MSILVGLQTEVKLWCCNQTLEQKIFKKKERQGDSTPREQFKGEQQGKSV